MLLSFSKNKYLKILQTSQSIAEKSLLINPLYHTKLFDKI